MAIFRRRWFWLALIGVALVGGGVAIKMRSSAGNERLEKVVRGPAIEAIYGIGKLDATRTFQAKAGVASGIERIPVKEGMAIKRGGLIVLLSEGDGIRSPFDGVVTRVEYKVGESVFAGNVIAEVIDPTDYEIRVVLDQRAAVKVRRGQKAKLSFDGLRDREILASVRAIYSSSSQFTVILDAKDLPSEVLPGMTADVSIEVSIKSDALLIPAASLQGERVERVRDGRRELIDVKTGLVNADKVEVTEGELASGDQVVVKLK